MTEPAEHVTDAGVPSSPVKPSDSNTSAQIYATMEEMPEPLKEDVQGFGSPAPVSPVINPSKHLDFGAEKTAESMTPSTPVVLSPVVVEDVDYNQFIMDTLMWTNRVRSGFYLATGALLILLVDWMIDRNIPLLKVVCHLTLAQMALNYLRHAINPKLQQKATWLDSAWTAVAIEKLAAGIKAAAAIHDKHLAASSAHKHLAIAAGLWMFSLLSGLIQPLHLLLVLYITAFIVPLAYKTNKAALDPKVKTLFSKAKARYDSAHHYIKSGIIMLGILLLGLISTTDLVIAFFVACLFASSQLPNEVEGLGKKVSPVLTPIGNTATKVGGHIGKLMGGAVEKYELTPTPIKKKTQ